MGLLIQTAFESAEGIPITSVYCKISSVRCAFARKVTVTIQCEAFVSRDKKIQGRRCIYPPGLSELTTVTVPLSGGWNSLESLYGILRSRFITDGFIVEDVFEEPVAESVEEQSAEPIIYSVLAPLDYAMVAPVAEPVAEPPA